MIKTVSIITPVFNAEKFIEKCINSVLSQTFKDWELILCDDRSTDNSVRIIKAFINKDPRIKLLSNKINGGAGVARNKALEYATGNYIAFLDGDDFWHEDKLKKQLEFIQKYNCGMVYSQYYVVNGGSNIPEYKICSPKMVTYEKMLCNDYIGFLTLMYDVKKVGKLFMPEIRKRQDWAYKLILLKNIKEAVGIQEPLAFYRIGNSSLSSNKVKLIKYNFEVFHKELGYSWLSSSFMMINFLIHYFYYKSVSKKKVNFQLTSS